MRVVIQRVKQASVTVKDEITGSIGNGLLILAGFEHTDTNEDIEWMVGKITRLRIFNDTEGVMNLSVIDVNGQILVISQFTLHAKTKKGNRPSYVQAAPPSTAIPLYEKFLQLLEETSGKRVERGIFGATMDVSLTNSGPVTIIIDSKNKDI